MISKKTIQQKTQELAQRDWDLAGITARFRKLEKEGIPRKKLNREEVIANKAQILDRVQKRRRIKQYLSLRRFPTISDTKAKFDNLVHTLALGANIKLIPPKDFEGSTYSLTLQFKSRSELTALQSKLEKIIRNPELKKFLLE